MNKNKRNFLFSAILILCSAIFTILVKVVDVEKIGDTNTEVGFSSVNQYIFNLTGVNMIWYHITDWLGILPILLAFVYAFVGLYQLIKRRSLFKVDKEILLLGVFYIITLSTYIFFESVVINCRPVLINGYLEASYPSSHTVMTLCLCISSIMVNKRLFASKFTKGIDVASIIIISVTVIGRLISGVHWFTDILGGILISASLIMTYYSVISSEFWKEK